jgi:hypothetical protein
VAVANKVQADLFLSKPAMPVHLVLAGQLILNLDNLPEARRVLFLWHLATQLLAKAVLSVLQLGAVALEAPSMSPQAAALQARVVLLRC